MKRRGWPPHHRNGVLNGFMSYLGDKVFKNKTKSPTRNQGFPGLEGSNMGWFRKRAEPEEEYPEDDYRGRRGYIDLSLLQGRETETARKGGGPFIKFADIDGYRQIPALSNLVYDGNILVLDFTPIANDDLELKRTINELKRVVEDIQGDIAGISQNLLIIAPKGFTIDKKKMRRMERRR